MSDQEKTNLDIGLNLVEKINQHDIRSEGKIDVSLIEKWTNYSNRQLSRIFNDLSTLTPIQYAERLRLIQCVEYIRKGNSLRDASIQFDYTPEGLSKAIKKQLSLTINDIKKENRRMSIKNGLHLGSASKFIELYKWEFDQSILLDYLDALQEQKITNSIKGTGSDRLVADGVVLHLDYKRVWSILREFDGVKVSQRVVDNLTLSESLVLYIIIMRQTGGLQKGEFQIPESLLASYNFLILFFFDINNPKFEDDSYSFILDKRIVEVLSSINEIEQVFKETFDIELQITFQNKKATVEFSTPFKYMLELLNRGEPN